jgi:hypothetical protein
MCEASWFITDEPPQVARRDITTPSRSSKAAAMRSMTPVNGRDLAREFSMPGGRAGCGGIALSTRRRLGEISSRSSAHVVTPREGSPLDRAATIGGPARTRRQTTPWRAPG